MCFAKITSKYIDSTTRYRYLVPESNSLWRGEVFRIKNNLPVGGGSSGPPKQKERGEN